MRTYGKNAAGAWVTVSTDSSGGNDYVWFTTLCQCLKLSLNESPFFANVGIPAQQTIVTQVYPDYYVAALQTLFAPYFANLTIKRRSITIPNSQTTATYDINVITHKGIPLNQTIAT